MALRSSHVTRHTSHVTRHTTHITRHTSHFTRHTFRIQRNFIRAGTLLGVCIHVTRDVRGGLWVVGCGLWVVGCGLWFVGCGLWFVGCGLWFVVCGLRFMVKHSAHQEGHTHLPSCRTNNRTQVRPALMSRGQLAGNVRGGGGGASTWDRGVEITNHKPQTLNHKP